MKAILISGSEIVKFGEDSQAKDFVNDRTIFELFLRKRVGLEKRNVFRFDFEKIRKFKISGLIKRIKKVVGADPEEPLIIYYSGHGREKFWSLLEKNEKPVKKFAFYNRSLMHALKKQLGPLIVIADSCYAMSLKRHLEKIDRPWLLLGLAPENLQGMGGGLLTNEVLKAWQNRKNVYPKFEKSSGKRVGSVIKKSYNKKFYGFKPDGKGGLRKFYFMRLRTKVKIVLRAGSDLDHLMFPKK